MIGTYVWRNFRRRKVRTVLMILSLVVGVGTLVALNATVDSYRRFYAGSVSGEVGDFDLVITRPDTELNRTIDVERLGPIIESVPGVTAVLPRIHAVVSIRAGDTSGDAALVALDPESDVAGDIETVDGQYDLSTIEDVPGAFVLQETADVLGVEVGDAIEIQFAAPPVRLTGQAASGAASRRRVTGQWEVRGIGTQRGLTGRGDNDGLVIELEGARERFGYGTTLAERLIVEYDRALYDSRDPQRSAFRTRVVTNEIRQELGDEGFTYGMPRPRAVIDGANQFIFLQSLITMYGLLSLSVVGMLIRTLVMTNVQEQTRDMAILRILGSPRRHLFALVVAEVAAVGAIGVGLGIVVGQLVNKYGIAPFLAEQAGDFAIDVPIITFSGVALAVATAGIVLAISTYEPARKAANTKVTHAINPGVADGIGLDDLELLRERRTDYRITGAGLIVLTYPLLIFFIFPLAFDFGLLWVLASLIFGALLAMIVGAALVFFVIVLPFERLLIWVAERLSPRAGYFIRRTVLRGKVRNTLIALMIVMSATLPSFLSTSLALEVANTDTDRRLSGGAAFRISPPSEGESEQGFGPPQPDTSGVFRTEILDEVRAEPAFSTIVGLTRARSSQASDGVGLRDSSVRVIGVDGDLRTVLYPEAIEVVEGPPEAFARLVEEPGAAVIGAGLATFFDIGIGDQLSLEGEGRDHKEKVTIIGIAKRVGGVGTFSAKQTEVWSGQSAVLIGLSTYRRLANDPSRGSPDVTLPIMSRLFASPAEGVDEADLTSDLRLRFATEDGLEISSTQESIDTTREESQTGQLFLIVLTALTSVLAVFGVFAVIYVSIYGRRGEIGMLKAMGATGRHLLHVFVGEAAIMTLSATLTGVSAGVLLAYALRMSDAFSREVPTRFAMDPIIVPAMLTLMIVASFISATVATHGYRKRPAVEIIRTL